MFKVLMQPKPAKRHTRAVASAMATVSVVLPNSESTRAPGLHLQLQIDGASQLVVVGPDQLGELEAALQRFRAA